ncbi:unnamed protein product [Candidula unifasciata]|uniref:Ion transport domain-containing protein n=1 Tax=Candidula unifasciata TaxID=100452 RepID=A0A8S3Z1N0_9EUPU|nr:unnamed protein product [Candidula unifasciata]
MCDCIINIFLLQKVRYFRDTNNALEWVLYITSLMFVVPFLFNVSLHWQWEAGAIAVFLSWFDCLVFLQRFDFFGIYVVMFLEILQTLLQVLSVFSILIIAFGLSFYILMFKEESKAYSTPALSLLRTFMMMLEVDYMGSFNELYVDGKTESLHFGNLTLVFLVVFVLLMPILLMNLLIGLAVGDIESVQRDARLKRLAMQVELHMNMERKMPDFLRKRVHLTKYDFFPNRCTTLLNSMFSMFTKTEMDSEMQQSSDSQTSVICQEMCKQKVRMREMNTMIEKNHHLLRKIMEKMEIHTEEDAWDEGGDLNSEDSDNEFRSASQQPHTGSTMRDLFLKKSAVDLWKGPKK